LRKSISREELEKKLKGQPDFILEEHYCRGMNTFREDAGLCVELVDRIPIVIPPNPFDEGYLKTKRERMNHLI